jgi:dipeptidyl aminopeptidase/acylaminoacyl peptidase
MSIRPGDGTAHLEILARDRASNLWVPRFSPDQQWITFLAVDAVDAPTSTAYVMPATGGEWTAVTDGGSFDDKPRWSPDGDSILFVSSRDGFLNLWGRRFDRARGLPIGDSFRVTAFEGQERILPTDISQLEFGVTRDHLFLPLSDTVGNLWVLEPADR